MNSSFDFDLDSIDLSKMNSNRIERDEFIESRKEYEEEQKQKALREAESAQNTAEILDPRNRKTLEELEE